MVAGVDGDLAVRRLIGPREDATRRAKSSRKVILKVGGSHSRCCKEDRGMENHWEPKVPPRPNAEASV